MFQRLRMKLINNNNDNNIVPLFNHKVAPEDLKYTTTNFYYEILLSMDWKQTMFSKMLF